MSCFNKKIKTACICGIFSLFITTTAFGAAYGTINGTDINVRASGSSSATILGQLDAGINIAVTGESGDWYKVWYNNADAYIAKQFLTITSADAAVKGTNVNIRDYNSTAGSIIAKMNNNDAVTVTGQADGWYRISYNGADAYIAKEFLSGVALGAVQTVTVETPVVTYGIVTSDNGLRLRADMSTESEIIEKLGYGEVVDVILSSGEWAKVKTTAGNTGFVSAEFIKIETGEKPESAAYKGQKIVDYAMQFLGVPYVYGGTNLNKGVDCSGFVYCVYKNFGITLNRSSRAQATQGVPVEKSQLIPGDLVFFAEGSSISHVGIYIGNGKYINATSGAEYSVAITEMSSSYSVRTYTTARRIL